MNDGIKKAHDQAVGNRDKIDRDAKLRDGSGKKIKLCLVTFDFPSINSKSMLSMIIGSGANIFILIVVIAIGIITGISVTDILKTKEKSED